MLMKLIEKIEMTCLSPPIIESRGTQAKFVYYANKILCVKFHAVFHSVTI